MNISRNNQKGFFSVGIGLLLLTVFGGISMGTDGMAKKQSAGADNDNVEIAQSVDESY